MTSQPCQDRLMDRIDQNNPKGISQTVHLPAIMLGYSMRCITGPPHGGLFLTFLIAQRIQDVIKWSRKVAKHSSPCTLPHKFHVCLRSGMILMLQVISNFKMLSDPVWGHKQSIGPGKTGSGRKGQPSLVSLNGPCRICTKTGLVRTVHAQRKAGVCANCITER